MAILKYVDITRQTERAKIFFEDRVGFTLGPVELKNMMNEKSIRIIDVRRTEDYDRDHIPNAISIPGKDIESSLSRLSKDNINIVYCYTQQCHLAAKAALILADRGYPAMELEGGYDAWKNIYDFDVVSG